jgi:hypothetical protein
VRTLRLNVVPLQGDDVAAVQAALAVHADGIFGVRTAAHVRSWKWQSGKSRRFVDEAMSPADQRRLLGEEPPSRAHRKRAAKRRRALETVWPLRSDPGEASEFRIEDTLGASSLDGRRNHAAKDWFAFAGNAVRAPVTGTLTEVKVDRRRSGQIFGGAIKIQSDLDFRVWVFRHVDPLPGITEGQRIVPA